MNCRWCDGNRGNTILDLGTQPACDDFPLGGDPAVDARYPLSMWLCADCGLAQLAEDPGTVEQPLGVEPAAVIRQGQLAVDAIVAAGFTGDTVREFGSPHGGSWLNLLRDNGFRSVADQADLVVDNFGLMHAADQRAALAERVAAVAPGGTLLLQYHSISTIVECEQWTSLRHGHFAYYSTTVLHTMLAEFGFAPTTAWRFDLYGGTILLAAQRAARPDQRVRELVAGEVRITTPETYSDLPQTVERSARRLRDSLTGPRVFGYGAASRAVALLAIAGVSAAELPAIADASPAKQGRRMPGSGVPIISPAELVAADPDVVLLFLPDLLDEVRSALPGVRKWLVIQ